MATSSERWIDRLQLSSLFWPPPDDDQQRKVQCSAYVEYLGQFTSERFSEDIAELIRSRFQLKEKRLFDDVLALFVLHHPENGHAIILPIISCIIDGALEYNRNDPPFASFISLFCPGTEVFLNRMRLESPQNRSSLTLLRCPEVLRKLSSRI